MPASTNPWSESLILAGVKLRSWLSSKMLRGRSWVACRILMDVWSTKAERICCLAEVSETCRLLELTVTRSRDLIHFCTVLPFSAQRHA